MSFKNKINIWILLSMIGVVLILLPLFFLVFSLTEPASENWIHIKEYVLSDLVLNTIILTGFTALFAAILGTALGYIMSMYDFYGKKTMKVLLILPMAIPSYIAAYTYSGVVSYTGPFQSFFRNNFGIKFDQKYFDIMSMPGAIFIFTITLYPYVYLLVKSFLENNSSSMIENAKLLGKNRFSIFFKIVLPILFPVIVGGTVLVCLEVLNDYGVTSYFGIQTFTTAIFQTWYGMFDVNSAVRLSVTMFGFVLLFLLIGKTLQNNKKYHISSSKERQIKETKLKGFKSISIFTILLIVPLICFIIPVLQMIYWAFLTFDDIMKDDFFVYVWNTLYISLIATTIIIIFNLIIANTSRLASKKTSIFLKLSTVGYIFPSAVLAIAVITLFVKIDNVFSNGELVISSSLAMLTFAYFVKYFSAGYQSIESGFNKTGNIYTEASRTLGLSMTKTFFKVDIFTIKNFIISGGILVFLDIIKELPLTLILRSFNFQTLSTKAYMYASDEQIPESSLYSLTLIFISVIFILLAHYLNKKEENHDT